MANVDPPPPYADQKTANLVDISDAEKSQCKTTTYGQQQFTSTAVPLQQIAGQPGPAQPCTGQQWVHQFPGQTLPPHQNMMPLLTPGQQPVPVQQQNAYNISAQPTAQPTLQQAYAGYGQPVVGVGTGVNVRPVEERPKTMLLPAVLVCMFCCFLPGMFAIMYASKVNSSVDAGDYTNAESSARTARMLIVVTLVMGLIIYIVSIVGFILIKRNV